MSDIAKSFRDGQVQGHAVKEKEKAVAAKRAAIEELKLQVAAAQEEYNRRKAALMASTRHIQPLQADVDAQWAQRNAFTSEQETRLVEIEGEERQLGEKLLEINNAIVETVAAIDSAKRDSVRLPETESRIVALERQLESDIAAIGHVERLVRADDAAVGQRIDSFDAVTGSKYPVDVVGAAVKSMMTDGAIMTAADDRGDGSAEEETDDAVVAEASVPARNSNRAFVRPNGSGGIRRSARDGGGATNIIDTDHSMMLMADDYGYMQ